VADGYITTMRHKNHIEISSEERHRLEKWTRSTTGPSRLLLRSRIVLMSSENKHDVEIAQELGCSRHTARLWRNRFLRSRIDGITRDAPGRGRKAHITEARIKRIVDATLHTTPDNATHWSVRLMAQRQNVSTMTIQRIWHRYNLKPHLVETFKLSKDQHFIEKLEDVVGLYLNPPDKALVLCFDEKSQIQALDRTRPILPLRPGIPERQTHDYIRHGTTTLFAALSMLDGKVIGECLPRHRHQEFIKFLNTIDNETPKRKELHLIVDNYATHKHPRVKAWLKRHKRFHFHFTPTSSSWLNLVERWFRELTDKRIRRGTFENVKELIAVIEDFIKKHNWKPKAFVWSASVTRILEKIGKTQKCISN
jgi:transposase